MRRTQLYITEEQAQLLAARAADSGVPKAEVIRRILDEALGLDDGTRERRRAITATANVLVDAPDWPEWLRSVRGADADERLRRLDV